MKTEYTKPYDSVISKLKNLIATKHQIPEYTKNELIENRHVKDFCCISKHFAMINNIPISYETEAWLRSGYVVASITNITLYDSLTEYESDRAEIYKSKDSEIPNLN